MKDFGILDQVTRLEKGEPPNHVVSFRWLLLVICYRNVLLLLSGGHGRALAGLYLEETRVGAAEAQRPAPEAGLRGAHPTVWVSAAFRLNH